MSEQVKAALEMVQGQAKELDQIYSQASEDLNTVAASERVAKWKIKTIGLIAQHLGQTEAKQFSQLYPGPSFTNDMLEELEDDVEFYRTSITALADKIKNQPQADHGSH